MFSCYSGMLFLGSMSCSRMSKESYMSLSCYLSLCKKLLFKNYFFGTKPNLHCLENVMYQTFWLIFRSFSLTVHGRDVRKSFCISFFITDRLLFSNLVTHLWSLKCNSDCHTFYGLSYYGKAVKLICRKVQRYFLFLSLGNKTVSRAWKGILSVRKNWHCARYRNLLIDICKISFLKTK